jgi:YHS domain-containing protein
VARDPVCGQEVDELRARAVSIYGGRTHYFCSAEHKAEFSRDPARFLGVPELAAPREVSRKELSRKELSRKEKEKEKERAKAKEVSREREDDTPLPAPAPPALDNGPASLSETTAAPAARPSAAPTSPEERATDAASRTPWLYVLLGAVALVVVLGLLSFWLARK